MTTRPSTTKAPQRLANAEPSARLRKGKEKQTLAKPAVATLTPSARLLVADDFRAEQSGKVLAIGLYADGVVLLDVPEGAPEPSNEIPVGVDRLAFLINIGGVVGQQKVSVRIGEKGPSQDVQVDVKPGSSANLIFTSQPMLIASYGKKLVTVKFAQSVHELEFELRKADRKIGVSLPKGIFPAA